MSIDKTNLDKESLCVAIEDDAIVIRCPLKTLKIASGHAFDLVFGHPHAYRVNDVEAFGREVVDQLNKEQEDGTTPVHLMFDSAMQEVVEQGGLSIDGYDDEICGECEQPFVRQSMVRDEFGLICPTCATAEGDSDDV